MAKRSERFPLTFTDPKEALMKGKFSNETAERLYGESLEGMHDSEHGEGSYWYALFVEADGKAGQILVEDSYGFVEIAEYDTDVMQVWLEIVGEGNVWDDDANDV